MFPQSFIRMYRNFSLNSSTDSDVFYVEHSLPEKSPIRNNTPAILNSTQLSGAMEPEVITISSVASPEPQSVTIDSDSNEPTFSNAFGTQHPIVPPSLNDFNLPANHFNVLATMAVIQQEQEDSPNHRSRLIRPQFQRPQWTWGPSKVGRQHKLPQTTTLSIRPKTSLDGCTGTFLLTRHSNQMNPDESLLLEAHPPHHRLHRDKREDWARRCLFVKRGECRSTSARHAAKPFQPERQPNAQGKTQTLYTFY